MDRAHFRCRRCDYSITTRYFGQWNTDFPICEVCGRHGQMDALETKVQFYDNGRVVPPPNDARFRSSRFGKGTDLMVFETPTIDWIPEDGPILRALFRCRECGMDFRGPYRGQWNTEFPQCRGTQRCENMGGGRVDCVEFVSGPIGKQMPYLSSRFGPGSEVLERQRTFAEMRPIRMDRSRSPTRRQESYRHREYEETSRRDTLPIRSNEDYGRREERRSSSRMSGQYGTIEERRSSSQIPERYGSSEERRSSSRIPERHDRREEGRSSSYRGSAYDTRRDHSREQFVPARSQSVIPISKDDFEGRNRSSYTPNSGLARDLSTKMALTVPQGPRLDTRSHNHSGSAQQARKDTMTSSDNTGGTTEQRHADGRMKYGKKKTPARLREVINANHFCLVCHTNGHAADICPGVSWPAKSKSIADMVPNYAACQLVASSTAPTTAVGLILLAATVQMVFAQERPYLLQRDWMLGNIYEQMCNHPREVSHGTWFSFMSAINSVVEQCFKGMLAVPLGSLKTALKPRMKTDEHFSAFVARVFGENGNFDVPKEYVDLVKREIERVLYRYENALQTLVVQMEEYLDSSAEVRGWHLEDAVWMTRAFGALLELQPNFKPNEFYIMRLRIPDFDNVIESLQLWDANEITEAMKAFTSNAASKEDKMDLDKPAEKAVDSTGDNGEGKTPMESVDTESGGAPIEETSR